MRKHECGFDARPTLSALKERNCRGVQSSAFSQGLMGESFLLANAKQNLGKGFGDVQADILENGTARLTQTVVRTDDCQERTLQ